MKSLIVYIGADHRGFRLKNHLKRFLERRAYTVIDCSPSYQEGDDYPDIAAAVAQAVARKKGTARGIVICGSGVGVDIVANKCAGTRCGLGLSPAHVAAARRDDDITMLALAADFTSSRSAQHMTVRFLTQAFARKPRYVRRIRKIAQWDCKPLRVPDA